MTRHVAHYLAAADVAVNPMFSGSGTNIKMFDFMAAGLPVISTPTGARGINLSESALHICAAREFAGALRHVLGDVDYARRLGTAARRLVGESYAWERLSPRLGRLLTRHRTARRRRPAFSVIVPTYERQAHLPTLLDCLARQTFRDFEVILVDQSAAPWNVPDEYCVARHPLRAHGPEGHEPRAQSRRVAGSRRRDRVHRRRLPARTGLAAECPALFQGPRASLAWKG